MIKNLVKFPELKGVCKYCIGCNRLELYDFIGIKNCKNFLPNKQSWYEDYRKEVLYDYNKTSNIMQKQKK